MDRLIALSASGLALGAVWSLTAVGFILLYKATGVFNFAQGDLITLSAYVAIWANVDLDLPIVVAYLVALGVLFMVGVAIERIAYAPLRRHSEFVIVISTFGAAQVIRSLMRLWQGSRPKKLESPVGDGSIHIGGAVISNQRVLIVAVAAVTLLIVYWILYRTSLGRDVRALADDRDVAQLYGVRTTKVSVVAFGGSAALAALAGVLIGPIGLVDPGLGFGVMLSSFAAAVLGGFGSLLGVVIAAIGIGVLQQVGGAYVLRDLKEIYPFVLMIVVVAARPQGLFRSEVGVRY